MLNPRICQCGCLIPIFDGDYLDHRGWIFNHCKTAGSPSYLVMDMGYKTPCWVWQRALNKWGYAKLGRSGKTQGGHRLFYRAYIGPLADSRAGSDGLDHLCRIRRCVNPEHVEPTTCVENIRRGQQVHIGRSRSKLEEHLEEIAHRYASGESQLTIARAFGVRQSCISRILRGSRWRGLVVPIPTRAFTTAKLSSEQAAQIRLLCASGETRESIAKRFGISRSHVSTIFTGRSWAATT